MSDRPSGAVSAVAEKQASVGLRERLVRELRTNGSLRSDRVACALLEMPREFFVPDIAASQGLEAVYRDQVLAVKTDARGQWLSSSSQPSVMALMLELLDLEPGQRVLEIGAGTGYNAALLRHLVTPTGGVTTIEIDRELASRARAALAATGHGVSVVCGDGRDGFADGAPYDRIIVTASVAEIPNAWVDQLRPGGRLVLPLRLGTEIAPHVIPALELRHGALESVAMTWGVFMPLRDTDAGQPQPPPSLDAYQWINGRQTIVMRVTAPALERLSDVARRRLLALVLGEPGSRKARGRVTTAWPVPPALLLYLLSRIPVARRIELYTPQRHAIGLVSTDGRSVAVASMSLRRLERDRTETLQRIRRDRWWTDSYGQPDLIRNLDDMLNEWRSLTVSGHTRLQIHARRSTTKASSDIDLSWEPRTTAGAQLSR